MGGLVPVFAEARSLIFGLILFLMYPYITLSRVKFIVFLVAYLSLSRYLEDGLRPVVSTSHLMSASMSCIIFRSSQARHRHSDGIADARLQNRQGSWLRARHSSLSLQPSPCIRVA
jgi:hypothetical protein